MDGCSIFREELAIRYPTHGHALWEPDPGGLYEAVAVGDVGFIRNGYFHRLFNALRLHDTPSDPDSSDGPKYPPRLQPKNPQHIRKGRDNHQDFFSKNVTKRSQDIYASGPDDTPVTFVCSGRQGALLYLPFLADHEETTAHGDFSKWIIKNIDDCFEVAEDLGCGVNRKEDIILVTGRHLARSWVSAAFSSSRGDAEVSFRIRVSGNSGVHFVERDVSGGELKLGPTGENPPENQCIFVQGYRVARLLNFWPRIRAAGSAPDMHDPEPESDLHLASIGIHSEANYPDPLHILLEYIAEQALDSDMILVHDNDLGFIGDALRSDTLMEHIRKHAPAIRQVRCELGNENRSGAEAESVMVATISQNSFEALHEEQNTLECSRSMDASRGTGSEIPTIIMQGTAAAQPGELPRVIPISSSSGAAISLPPSTSSPMSSFGSPLAADGTPQVPSLPGIIRPNSAFKPLPSKSERRAIHAKSSSSKVARDHPLLDILLPPAPSTLVSRPRKEHDRSPIHSTGLVKPKPLPTPARIRAYLPGDEKRVRIMVARAQMESLVFANSSVYSHPVTLTVWVCVSSMFIRYMGWWPNAEYGILSWLWLLPAFLAPAVPMMFLIGWKNRLFVEDTTEKVLQRIDLLDIQTYYARSPASGFWILEYADKLIGLIAIDASLDAANDEVVTKETGDRLKTRLGKKGTSRVATIRHFFAEEVYRHVNIEDDLLRFAVESTFNADRAVESIRMLVTPLRPAIIDSLRRNKFSKGDRIGVVGIQNWEVCWYTLERAQWRSDLETLERKIGEHELRRVGRRGGKKGMGT